VTGRIALAADVTVALAGGAPLDEPPSLTRYVLPERERGLAALAAQLRARWDELVRDEWLAGTIDHARARRTLVAQARQDAQLHLGAATVDDDGRVVPSLPLLEVAVATPWTHVSFTRSGAPAARRAAGRPAGWIELYGDDVGAVGGALARLAAGVASSELARDPVLRRVADAAAAAGALATAPARAAFADQLEPDTIATLGGPTLLANLAGAHVLVDPVLGPVLGPGLDAAAGAVPAPAVRDLPPLAAIVLTSDDPATLDPGTLMLLDRSVPVWVPDRGGRGRVADLLRDLGFADVLALAPGMPVAIGDGGALLALPAPVAPRPRARSVIALAGRATAALVTGPFAVDDAEVAPLAARVAELNRRVSPLFVASPRRRHAPIERGWQWLLEPADTWLRPYPATAPRLQPLVAAAGATAVVVLGDDAALPGDVDADVRLAEAYDRYRLGGGQDGWLQPRAADDDPG